MNASSPITTTIYAQLQELALSEEVRAFFPGAGGHASMREVRGRNYWYWSGRTGGPHPRTLYLGPDEPSTQWLVEAIRARQEIAAAASATLESATAAFVAAGGMPSQPTHARALEHLADAGLFRKGLFVVGSHAFVAYGNMLGVRFSADVTATLDVDFARAEGVALAVPTNRSFKLDVPAEFEKFDRSSFLVPGLDPRVPSTSLKSNRTQVKLDFLTTRRRREDDRPVFFEDLNIAATPLRFMDYLLGGDPARGLLICRRSIPVTLPDPARFACHKLVISQERPVSSAIKARKDVVQAGYLFRALSDMHRSSIERAREALKNTQGAVKRFEKALAVLSQLDPQAAEIATG